MFTPQAAAGDLWLPDDTRTPLAEVVIPDNNLIRLRPHPALPARMRVAVVGLGGVGSLIVELLARLGVGELVLIDADPVDATNLPRLVAAERGDIGKFKTELAARNATRANPHITLTVIPERVEGSAARQALTTCDWIFLAADTAVARHWVNDTVHRHLIPATQAGVKIPVDKTGNVGQIHAISRILRPGRGCMWCNELIDATELAIDMHPETEREQARYVQGVTAPSVITLNSLAVAEAVNHFMLAVTALHTNDSDHTEILHRPRSHDRDLLEPKQNPACPTCSLAGSLGRGPRLLEPHTRPAREPLGLQLEEYRS